MGTTRRDYLFPRHSVHCLPCDAVSGLIFPPHSAVLSGRTHLLVDIILERVSATGRGILRLVRGCCDGDEILRRTVPVASLCVCVTEMPGRESDIRKRRLDGWRGARFYVKAIEAQIPRRRRLLDTRAPPYTRHPPTRARRPRSEHFSGASPAIGRPAPRNPGVGRIFPPPELETGKLAPDAPRGHRGDGGRRRGDARGGGTSIATDHQ